MKTDNYILINGKPFLMNASLADVVDLKSKLQIKLTKSYTFEMRTGLRRVLKFTVTGKVYSVLGPRQYSDWNVYTQSSLYFGFDRARAKAIGGEVHEFDASELDFTQPHIKRLFKLGGAK